MFNRIYFDEIFEHNLKALSLQNITILYFIK